ncbi:MAG: VWA domain-containing protein [Alistipes indistinctus]
MVSRQGTALGAAIELASGSFSSGSEGSRVIILISDGENHEDDAMAAAEAAAKQGIKSIRSASVRPKGRADPHRRRFHQGRRGQRWWFRSSTSRPSSR